MRQSCMLGSFLLLRTRTEFITNFFFFSYKIKTIHLTSLTNKSYFAHENLHNVYHKKRNAQFYTIVYYLLTSRHFEILNYKMNPWDSDN